MNSTAEKVQGHDSDEPGFPLTSLKAELLNPVTALPQFMMGLFAFAYLIRGDYWFALLLFLGLFILFVVPAAKRFQVRKLYFNNGELNFIRVKNSSKVKVAGTRLTLIFNGKFTLLFPDGHEEELLLPSEWINGQPIRDQFLQELQKAGCLVDLYGWQSVSRVPNETETVDVCEELTQSRSWYDGIHSDLEDSLKHKTKFAAVQTITLDKGRIKLNRRGYEIFDLADTDVKVELLYGIDRKKRGHTRLCLIGPAGERHFLSDWKGNSVFAGKDSSTIQAHLLNRGIKVHRDPYVITEFEAPSPSQ